MILATAMLCSLISWAPATEPTAAPDELASIVLRHVHALGGRDQLLAHRSVKRTLAVTMPDGSRMQVVQEHQRPDQVRIESRTAQGVSVYTSFDGQQAWNLAPGQTSPTKLSGDEAVLLEREADMDGPLVDYQIKGHELSLLGREDVGGRPTDHLRLVRKGAPQDEDEHYYLDTETSLPIKVVTNRKMGRTIIRRECRYADYRPVDGIQIAHRINETQFAGGEWASEQVVESVVFGGQVATDHFRLTDATSSPARERIPPLRIADDAAARAIYRGMIAALRQAASLSFQSRYSVDLGGLGSVSCTYQMWLKKPNQFRMEAKRSDGTRSGVLVGDGSTSWIFWPGGRPVMSLNEDPAESRTCVYMRKPSPLGHHSIGHDAALLGAGMVMTILDASTFHGYTDSLQPLIDAVGGVRTETFDGEACDVVQVSFMDGQRSWELWIARRDHLPRKLREIVRVHVDLIAEEHWTDVRLGGELADALFRWTPPDGWQEWQRPEAGTALLAAGTPAPDFDLELAGGGKQRLSDLRGSVVMLVFWRAG